MTYARSALLRAHRCRLARAGRILFLALALGAPTVRAAGAQPLDSSSRTAAIALATAGLEAYDEGLYRQALDKLEKAYALARVPTLGLWSARTLARLHLLLEAEARYRETVALEIPDGDYEVQKQALVDAQNELQALSPTIPRLLIQVDGARLEKVELSIDGQLMELAQRGLRVNPGAHRVEGRVGEERQALEVNAAPNENRVLLLRFEAPASPAREGGRRGPEWLRTSGWVALGVGGSGLALGAVAGALTLKKRGEMRDNEECRGVKCRPEQRDLVDGYNARLRLTKVGFLAGGILAAAGVGVLIFTGSSSESVSAHAFVTPELAGIGGQF